MRESVCLCVCVCAHVCICVFVYVCMREFVCFYVSLFVCTRSFAWAPTGGPKANLDLVDTKIKLDGTFKRKKGYV